MCLMKQFYLKKIKMQETSITVIAEQFQMFGFLLIFLKQIDIFLKHNMIVKLLLDLMFGILDLFNIILIHLKTKSQTKLDYINQAEE